MYLFTPEIYRILSEFIDIFRNSLSSIEASRFDIIHARALSGVSANTGKCGVNPKREGLVENPHPGGKGL